MGLGFVLSFGYWCTDFLVVQRAMAADSMNAARRTPVIAALPKMIFPFLVIVPGIIALGLTLHPVNGTQPVLPLTSSGGYDYNMALPMMMARYYPEGMLGVGLTALMASFMSGMAGNVTAFNTVWTYDLYQSYLVPGRSDEHYLTVGRATTIVGTLLSVAAAYLAMRFNNIMDMLQLIFSFVNAPLFATFLLGMFWKRTTGHGAFWGLVAGTLAASLHYEVTSSSEADHSFQNGRRARVRLGHGAEFLGCDVGLDRLFSRDDCRQRRHQPEARRAAEGPRVRPHAARVRCGAAVASSSRHAGRHRHRPAGRPQRDLLVT
jgi:SSS family solute:Na+ symporter